MLPWLFFRAEGSFRRPFLSRFGLFFCLGGSLAWAVDHTLGVIRMFVLSL